MAILAFTGIAEVETALRQRRCVGWLYDDNLIAVMLASGPWNDVHMPLASQSDTPWGLAVRLEDLDRRRGRFMAGMVAHWHRSGKLLRWEKEVGEGGRDRREPVPAPHARGAEGSPAVAARGVAGV